MASGLIYLLIIGMWVAYFLPRWLSHHHENSGRNAERYKSAIKSVTEKEGLTEDPYTPEKKKKDMARRRQVFAGLGTIFVLHLIIATVGILPWTTILVSTSAIGIYCVSARRQVLASQARARKLKALQQITAAKIADEPAEKISLSRESTVPGENWIPLAERLDSAAVVVIPKQSKSWEPIQVPKPTYVSAPKAIPAKRVIDLTGASAPAETKINLEETIFPVRDDVFDQELAEQAAVLNVEFLRFKAVND